jgi:hypothetical protein
MVGQEARAAMLFAALGCADLPLHGLAPAEIIVRRARAIHLSPLC